MKFKKEAAAEGCPFHKIQQELKRQPVSEQSAERFWDWAGVSLVNKLPVESLEVFRDRQIPVNDHKSIEAMPDSDGSPKKQASHH